MDEIIKMEELPKAGAIQIGEIKSTPGGKGNNQAVACSRAGGKVTFIGVVGNNNDYDKILTKFLKDNNINPILDIRKNEDCHKATVVIDSSGMGRIVVKPNADVYLSKNIIDDNINELEKSEIIILDLEIPLETVEYVINKCYQSQKQKKIILRPSFILSGKESVLPEKDKKTFENIIKKVNYLIVDESELNIISGQSTNCEEEVKKACQEFMKKEPQNLIVILKYEGCRLWNKEVSNKEFRSYYKKEDVADFSGAVDCFIGVFAAYLHKNYQIDEAIKYANLALSISAKKFGIIDSFPKLDEINREREKINDW